MKKIASLGAILCAGALSVSAAGKPVRHVVVIVWDGMRPDMVSETRTPNLYRLGHDGVVFQNHHSVYPTSTEVNGAAIATGGFPAHNGLLANREYRPRIDSKIPVDTGEDPIIRKGDAVSDGHYLALPTIAEIVERAGGKAAIAGSKSVVLLQDRHRSWVDAKAASGLTKFAATMSADVAAATLKLLGPFLTNASDTNAQRNTYATRSLTEVLWRDGLPRYSLLWLSEPDLTQHETSPGSPAALAAIKNCDTDLGLLLQALRKDRANTDLFVVSDHGFSTIERAIDFPAELNRAGFHAAAKFAVPPKPGEIMIVGNGGTILFYVTGHDPEVTARLVAWLQHSDFAGVIFTAQKMEGTFPLDTLHLDTSHAPDVVVALRWTDRANHYGVPGSIITDNGRQPGNGSHATLSKFDVHNLLIASGPDLPAHTIVSDPTSNADLAPTILHVLGLTPPDRLDGSVLTGHPPNESNSETLETSRAFPEGKWQQHLRVTKFGGETYIDEGNGAFAPTGK